jgi:hypothetical protein
LGLTDVDIAPIEAQITTQIESYEEFRSKAADAPPTVRIKPTRDNYEQRAYPSDRFGKLVY